MRRAIVVAAGALVLAGRAVPAQGRPARAVPEVVGSAIDRAKDINFASGVWPARVYVGQQATYQIGIFLSDDLRSRLRSNPQFVPPDVRSMIAYDLPLPSRLYTRREGDRTYDVHVFARALFPLAAGVHTIAPARLTWSVPLSSSIFSREESHTARSASQSITVVEPPVPGRPAGYQGAVGRISVRARLDAAATRVGDPVLLTLTVSGVGNVGLFPRPALSLPWGHAVAGPERVRVDSTAALIAGDKEFEWVVTPRVAGAHAVPEIRYPFFNPYTEQYEVAVTAPLGIRVVPGALAAAPGTETAATPRLTVRRVLRDDVPPPWTGSPLYWAGVALLPIPAIVRRWRRREHRAPAPSARRGLASLVRATSPDAREVRRALRAALVERVPALRAQVGADPSRVERALRHAGVSAATARSARELLAELDEIAWDVGNVAPRDMGARVATIMDAVDAEATGREPVRAAGTPRWPSVVLVLVSGAGVVGAATSPRDNAAFAAAVAAYEAGEADFARQAFLDLATRRPRAADAWANVGTASWQLGDTAGAVVGWQRALRLEPTAGDVRSRLAGTPSFRDGVFGDVPPVPHNAGGLLALLLWVGGWGILAARPRQGIGGLPAGVLGAAMLVSLASAWFAERLRGHDQVVVVSPERLREAPAVSSQAGANVMTGETGRVILQQGAWSRVRFADSREGWLDARRVQSLELPPPR